MSGACCIHACVKKKKKMDEQKYTSHKKLLGKMLTTKGNNLIKGIE